MTEPTPQELVAEVRAAVDSATAGDTAAWLAIDNNKRTWLGQLCTALAAALDAREEMRRDVVEWFAAKNDKANGAPRWAHRLFEAEDALIRIAQATPTGVSLRAELAELKAQLRDCLASPDCDLRNCETLGALL